MSTRRNRPLNTVLALALPALLECCLASGAATFDVHDYGAHGDGRTLDSPAIQKAINACAKAGGGTIRLGPGTYLSGPLFLRGNHTTLQLDAGAVLQGTVEFTNYRNSKGKIAGLINATRLTDVSITGAGVIDGAGAPWWPAVREAKKTGAPEPRQRPKMVNFKDCHGVTVRGVTLQNAPSFHLMPVDCDDVLIDHVTIKAPADSPNTDAIDPSACRNVRILNCLLDVGDDNVAVKAGHAVPGRTFCCQDILVSNCVCLHGHGISIGSETSGGVSNFRVVRCTFNGTVSGIRIKTTREKGGRVENILYSDIAMKDVRRPIDIACYYPKVPKDDPARPVTSTTPAYIGIRIESLIGDSPEGAGLIVGLPESPIRGVTLSNVHLKAVTGLLVENAEDVNFKDVKVEVEQGEPVIAKNAKVH
ncbi:MAG: glycoside hydrolase family 28 protein [Limisphaerales bacterium]